jgi:hypothetical protein
MARKVSREKEFLPAEELPARDLLIGSLDFIDEEEGGPMGYMPLDLFLVRD